MPEQYDREIDCHRRIVALKPGNVKENGRLITLLLRHGHVDEAAADLRKAIRLDPAEKQFHSDLAMALLVQGNVTEALAEYHKAIKISDRYALAYNGIAWVRTTAGGQVPQRRRGDCLRPTCLQVEQQQRSAHARHSGGRLRRGGQFDKAIQTVRRHDPGREGRRQEAARHAREHRKLFEGRSPSAKCPICHLSLPASRESSSCSRVVTQASYLFATPPADATRRCLLAPWSPVPGP